MFDFRLIQKVIIIFAAMLLAACASQNINWDYDPGKPLTNLKTYAWIKSKQNIKKTRYRFDSLTDQRVHNAANHILQKQGYKQVALSDHKADFLVHYMISEKTHIEAQQVATNFGYGSGWRGMGASTDLFVNQYEESTLLINIINPKTKNAIWQGTYTFRHQNGLSPQKRTQRIDHAVTAILKGFPRPPEK